MVDPEDWIDLHKHKWFIKRARGGIYAYRKKYRGKKSFRLYMHREIMNTLSGFEVHHKNRNTLDNRRANLENVTPGKHQQIAQIGRIARRRGPRPKPGCQALPHKKYVDNL